jgi:hypothetical protein
MSTRILQRARPRMFLAAGLLVFNLVAIMAATAQPAGAAICWYISPTGRACSICGTGTLCTDTVCAAGWTGAYCPGTATENVRLVPAGTTVPGCETWTSGAANCTTAGGATTWCTQTKPCDPSSSCAFDYSRTPLTRYCSAPTATAVGGGQCGLTAATGVSGTCPPGS